MKALILCGGRGVLVPPETQPIPKGLMQIGERALLWHVMRRFSLYGINEFVLALGAGGEKIRDYFIDFARNHFDVKYSQKNEHAQILGQGVEQSWQVTFVNTGLNAGTGARVSRCREYLDDADFFVTYSDCLANVDLNRVKSFHENHNKLLTVTGVQPIYRYGEFIVQNETPVAYNSISKVTSEQGFINGGYMLMRKGCLDLLSDMSECILEKDVFEKLVKKQELRIYPHKEFWYSVDHIRDIEYLHGLWLKNESAWLHL